MVATGLSSLVMAGVISTFVYVNRMCIPMLRNVELDQQAQLTLGAVAREIREATNVVQFSPNLVVVATPASGAITYKWNQDTKTVDRIGNGSQKTLLTGCDAFSFKMLKALPIDGQLSLETTTNLAECKALAISLECSRASFTTAKSKLSSTASATAVLRVKVYN
jgi:hypothetical protein